MFLIREAAITDLNSLQELYLHHLTAHPPADPPDRQHLLQTLESIVNDAGYHILVGEEGGRAVSSATLIVIRNLTHNGRPYAVIENVVTHADFRGRGHASKLMARAVEIARAAGCYKVMLLTGSKKENTLAFYERCGFNRADKTGFIRWL
jgi:GNAT superfamily N-acetyltransferase